MNSVLTGHIVVVSLCMNQANLGERIFAKFALLFSAHSPVYNNITETNIT